MNLQIVQSPSKNFYSRSGYDPTHIVIHKTDGFFPSDLHWLQGLDPRSEVSSHYYIAPDGTVHQLVQDDKGAWHAGKIVNPTAKLRKHPLWLSYINPNLYSLGIECSVPPNGRHTEPQWKALKELVTELSERHTIAIDREHVWRHNEIRGDKTCPGTINVDALVEELQDEASPPVDEQQAVIEALEAKLNEAMALLNKL